MNTAAGPTKRHVARRRVAHARAGRSPKRPGVYSVHVTRDRLGRRTDASFDALPIVRAAATGTATAATQDGRSRASRTGTSFAVGAALDDPSQGAALQTARPAHRPHRRCRGPRGATTPDPSLVAALQRLPGRARQRARAERLAAAGRRCRPRGARPVRGLARAADAQPAVARARSRADDRRRRATTRPRSTRSAPRCRRCCRTRPVGITLDGAQAPKATLTALGAITPDVVAFHPAPAAGKGLWTTCGAPPAQDRARSRHRHRATGHARRAARAERRVHHVARLRRTGRRSPARPAEPGDRGDRRSGGLSAARRGRLPGSPTQVQATEPDVSDRRGCAGVGAVRL